MQPHDGWRGTLKNPRRLKIAARQDNEDFLPDLPQPTLFG
jgi:hypothetical protein